jgi:enoyl-CoA hydratase
MSGHVEFSVSDKVGRIVLSRPEKHNAVTADMARELGRICSEINNDDSVRVATIVGAGERAFSTGSDLRELAAISDVWAFRNRVNYAGVVRNIRKPVISGLRGWVLGGGLEIALATDIRIAGRSARFGMPEVLHGWVGGGGGSQMLPRAIGCGRATLMLLLGDTVDADEALRIGLVEQVTEDDEVLTRTAGLAARIASLNPTAVQAVKAAVRAAISTPLEAGLRTENDLYALCMSEIINGQIRTSQCLLNVFNTTMETEQEKR